MVVIILAWNVLLLRAVSGEGRLVGRLLHITLIYIYIYGVYIYIYVYDYVYVYVYVYVCVYVYVYYIQYVIL